MISIEKENFKFPMKDIDSTVNINNFSSISKNQNIM